MEDTTRSLRVIAAIAGVAMSLWIASGYFTQGGDLTAEWLTARAVIDGVNPYQPISDLAAIYDVDTRIEAVNPRTPAALLISVPLGLVPYSALPSVAVVGVVTILAATAWILFGERGLWGLPVFFLTFAGAAIALHGHLSMAVLGLCGALVVRRDSGVAAGIAVSLKLFPALWVVALAVARKWRAMWIAVSTFVALNLLGQFVLGIELEAAVDAVLGIESMAVGHTRNGSLLSVGVPIAIVVLLGLGFITLWPRESLLRAALPASVLLGPIGWIDYLVLTIAALERRAATGVVIAMLGVRLAGAPSQSTGLQVLWFALIVLVILGSERTPFVRRAWNRDRGYPGAVGGVDPMNQTLTGSR